MVNVRKETWSSDVDCNTHIMKRHYRTINSTAAAEKKCKVYIRVKFYLMRYSIFTITPRFETSNTSATYSTFRGLTRPDVLFWQTKMQSKQSQCLQLRRTKGKWFDNMNSILKSGTKCYADVSYGTLPKPQARVYFFQRSFVGFSHSTDAQTAFTPWSSWLALILLWAVILSKCVGPKQAFFWDPTPGRKAPPPFQTSSDTLFSRMVKST